MPPKFVSFLKATLDNQLVKSPYDVFFLETVEGETDLSLHSHLISHLS